MIVIYQYVWFQLLRTGFAFRLPHFLVIAYLLLFSQVFESKMNMLIINTIFNIMHLYKVYANVNTYVNHVHAETRNI